MDQSTVASRGIWWTLFGLTAFVAMFFELGDFRTYGTHEVFSVVPAREMLHSGDYIVPYSGGLPRLRKPPLNYWLLAGTAALFGELNEWTTRLPAAISAVLLALLMRHWARRWYGEAAGWAAAFMQLTAVWALTYGRKSEVDMLLCLLMMSAMYLIANQPDDEPSRPSFWRWTAIFGLLAVSWLAKFHFGPALVLLPTAIFWLVQRQPRNFLRMANPLGWLLMAAAMIIWPYLVWRQFPGAIEVWQRETLGRAVGGLDSQPLWFYLPYITSLPLPWTPFALRAIPASWRAAWKEQNPRERFLWIWAFTHLVVVHAQANKHSHYLNAMMPVMTLLAAQGVARLAAGWRAGTKHVEPREAVIVSLLAIAGATGVIVGAGQKWPELHTTIVAVCGAAVLSVLLVYGLLLARRYEIAARAAIAGLLCCYFGVIGWLIPGQDERAVASRFAQTIRRELGADSAIVGFQLEEHDPVVYYIGAPVERVLQDDSLADLVARRRSVIAIGYEKNFAGLRKRVKLRERHALSPEAQTLAQEDGPLVVVELTPRKRPVENVAAGERTSPR